MEFNATFLVSIISFLVFVWIMNTIFYAPLTKIIEEREKLVNENYEHSKKAKEEAETIERDREARLTQTAKESRQIMVDKTNEANSDYKTRVQVAKTQANESIEVKKEALAKDTEEAKKVLNSRVEELAQTIVNKVLEGGQNG